MVLKKHCKFVSYFHGMWLCTQMSLFGRLILRHRKETLYKNTHKASMEKYS
jgi:hypothetical protein